MSIAVPSTFAALALLAAYFIDRLLRHASSRLPRAFWRWRGQAAAQPAAERRLRLALAPLRLAVWLMALDTAAAQFPALRMELLGDFADGLWTPLFEIRGRVYTTLEVVLFPLALLIAWGAIRLFIRFFLCPVLASAGVAHGVREAISLLVRYALIGAAVMCLLQIWGFDVSNLALVASVLGVGIGFGLQNIANNFISGLIISLERPIQLGDFIRVGEWAGTVERIGPRCVEINTTDRISILVPNSRLLEGDVVNWTHGDPRARLHIPVRVAYGSDIATLRLALLDAARGHPAVLGEPRPDVALRSFDGSALDLELLVWTQEPQRQERLKSDLNYRIEDSLRRYGVEVPPPEQDLNLRAPQLDELLRVTVGHLAVPAQR